MHALEQRVPVLCETCLDRSAEEVTTVYEEVRKCHPSDIAACLLNPSRHVSSSESLLLPVRGKIAPSGKEAFSGEVFSLALRRAASLLSVLETIGPNLEASALPPIDPFDPMQLQALSGKSWPHALGRRIVLPSSAPPEKRAAAVFRILLNMSYL